MKIKVDFIIMLVLFACIGCGPNLTIDPIPNHAKIGLVVKYNLDESRYPRAQLSRVRGMLTGIEQEIAESTLQVLRLETLYDIEVVKEKDPATYQYLLRIARIYRILVSSLAMNWQLLPSG